MRLRFDFIQDLQSLTDTPVIDIIPTLRGFSHLVMNLRDLMRAPVLESLENHPFDEVNPGPIFG
ncbi:unnamed protein product [marine sediment metagenome]|uniref:Uncharacterized protein n=1 Tax=marine sediment metagenome TaxID=412755 RepID=X1L7T0_9ZZZZ